MSDIPKGQAKADLVDTLRGHACWLRLKGYDGFAKYVFWAANIIEGLE